MRIATNKHLEALSRITAEVIQLSPQLEALGLGSLEVVNHNTALDNLDGALAAGITALDHLAAEFNRLMNEFQKAVADLIGEHPAPGETPADFFSRICALAPKDFQMLARKNGFTFAFTATGGA